ncbi:hypothetical protein JAAARDRAFT_682744 [Jaapia argillacea MUCL 33604]|uniref:F-box domain-containing protein n=1 Tax=Jaapia argillacea MUCL 33604 TaxID=933084 RepID=A0A067QMY0_9AGAM|nr:hypothetical protein JAAARDRAFT_682744 [Jaapia argillacea MUCL 33604]
MVLCSRKSLKERKYAGVLLRVPAWKINRLEAGREETSPPQVEVDSSSSDCHHLTSLPVTSQYFSLNSKSSWAATSGVSCEDHKQTKAPDKLVGVLKLLGSMLLSIPLELVHSIVDKLDKPSDILALALTCRFLKDILIPFVLNYREIVTVWETRYFPLWKRLAQDPSLAQNVRNLRVEVDLPGPPITIVDSDESTPESLEITIFQGLGHMSNLVEFSWSRSYGSSFVSIDFNTLFATLRNSCPMLNTLNLWDRVIPNAAAQEELTSRNASLCQLRDIESFTYKVFLYDSIALQQVSPPHLIKFLSLNPSLRVVRLELDWSHPEEQESIGDLHLPSLQTFEFTGFQLQHRSTIPRFLSNHPSLEIVKTDAAFRVDDFSVGALPNLREFQLQRLNAGWINLCLGGPPLRVLNGIWLEEGEIYGNDSLEFKALQRVSSTLETVYVFFELPDTPISWVHEAVPNATVITEHWG